MISIKPCVQNVGSGNAAKEPVYPLVAGIVKTGLSRRGAAKIRLTQAAYRIVKSCPSKSLVTLARTLNSPGKVRVILWERDQLEPWSVYERSKDRLGGVPYASSLIDMVQATEKLF